MTKRTNIVMTPIVNGYLTRSSFLKTVINAVTKYLNSPMSYKYGQLEY